MKALNFTGIVALVALAFFLGSKRSELVVSSGYEVINAVLAHKVDSLEAVLLLYRQNEAVHAADDADAQSEINTNTVKFKENEIKYERDIVALDSMSFDPAFRFFTDYITGK